MDKVQMRFFLHADDKDKLARVARAEGLSASSWLRQRVIQMLAEIPEQEPRVIRPTVHRAPLEESST